MSAAKPVTPADIEAAYGTICQFICEQCADTEEERANLEDTPARAAKALHEIIRPKAQIRAELETIVSRIFPGNASERTLPMVVHGPTPLVSMCPHHLFLVEYDCFIAYLPQVGAILGISKLDRIAQMLAGRPVLQEQLAEDIADVLYQGDDQIAPECWPSLSTNGSAVYLRGRHTCQSCRGVKSPAFTSSTAVRGNFEDAGLEQRFLTQVQMIEQRGGHGR